MASRRFKTTAVYSACEVMLKRLQEEIEFNATLFLDKVWEVSQRPWHKRIWNDYYLPEVAGLDREEIDVQFLEGIISADDIYHRLHGKLMFARYGYSCHQKKREQLLRIKALAKNRPGSSADGTMSLDHDDIHILPVLK